jgi:hypothetical protein
MKTKIYTMLIMLALLPAATLHSEVITGISDPFIFGDPPPSVPLSPITLVVVAFLIGIFVYRGYLSNKKQVA